MLCQFLLYNKGTQLYVYMSYVPSLLALPPTYLTHVSSQSNQLNALCFTAASHQLSILHVVVYTCQSYSPSSSHPSLPLRCPHLFSASMSLFLPCTLIHLCATCLWEAKEREVSRGLQLFLTELPSFSWQQTELLTPETKLSPARPFKFTASKFLTFSYFTRPL